MKHRILAGFLVFALIFSGGIFALADAFTVTDAYNECQSLYPDFVAAILQNGATEQQIITFLGHLHAYMYRINKTSAITEENFKSHLISSTQAVLEARANLALQDALIASYPAALITAALNKEIHEDFIPLYETVKSMVFTHKMLETDPQSGQTVISFAAVDLGKVEYNTPASKLALPEKISVMLADGSAVELEVQWNHSSYDPVSAKNQVITGALVLGSYIMSDGLKNQVSATVAVKSKSSGGGGGGGGGNSGGPVIQPPLIPGDPSTPVPTKKTFGDVPEAHWANAAIDALANAKTPIFSGYEDGLFRPDNAISRAEFAKIIVQVSGTLLPDAASGFTDVDAADWFAPFVSSAKAAGLIAGYNDKTFRPNALISRADICVIIYRYLKAHDPDFPAASQFVFPDDPNIPEYAKGAVYALHTLGIISGMEDGSFSPNSNATRAQAAKILYMTMTLLAAQK